MMAEMDQMPSDTVKISVRDYIDKFMEKQGKLLNVAKISQKRPTIITSGRGTPTINDYRTLGREEQ